MNHEEVHIMFVAAALQGLLSNGPGRFKGDDIPKILGETVPKMAVRIATATLEELKQSKA